jgi:hypothetical protein
MSTPTIGDTVHYTDPLRRKCAAIVTNQDGPMRLRLAVFEPNGQISWVWALPYDPAEHGEDFWRSRPTVGYWQAKS